MSTVMYAFRVYKKDFWPLMKQVREVYKLNHFAFAFEKEGSIDKDTYDNIARSIDAIDQHGYLKHEIQLFELNSKEYLFRVLENGFMFLNSYEKEGWNVRPCFYDTRTDRPNDVTEEEYVELAKIAEWLDGKINAREYFLCPIFSKDDLLLYYWNKVKVWAKAQNEGI